MASTTIHTLAYKIVGDGSKFKTEMSKVNAEIRAGKAVTEAYMPALDKHQREIESLNMLYARGRIDVQTYNRAVAAQKRAMFEASTAGKALNATTSSLTARVAGLAGAYLSLQSVWNGVLTQAKEIKEISDLAETFKLPTDEIDKVNFAIKSEGGAGLDTIQAMGKHLGELHDKFKEGDKLKPLGKTDLFKSASTELKSVVGDIGQYQDKLTLVKKQYDEATEALRRFNVLNKSSILTQSEKFRLIDLKDRITELATERNAIIASQMQLESQRFELMGTVAEEARKANDIVVVKQNDIQKMLDKYQIQSDKFFTASLPDKLLLVSDAVAQLKTGEEKLAAINDLLGKGSSQWADGILKGRDGLQALFDKYEKDMERISPDMQQKSEDLIQATKDLNTAWIGFSRTLIETLGPALAYVLSLAKDALEVLKMLNPGYIENRVQRELDSMFPGREQERQAKQIDTNRTRVVTDFSRIKQSYGLPAASEAEISRIRESEADRAHETANLMLFELRRLNGIVDKQNDQKYYSNESPAVGR